MTLRILLILPISWTLPILFLRSSHVMLCALLDHLCNFENVKIIHGGGVLLLVKLQAEVSSWDMRIAKVTAQKKKFSIKNRIWSHLLKKSLMENFIFCAVSNVGTVIEVGNTSHWVKSVRIRSFSGPYFLAFRLNTETYGLSFRIQSKWGKIRTRKSPNTDTFQAVSNSKNTSAKGNINYKRNTSSVVGFNYIWINVYEISNMGTE